MSSSRWGVRWLGALAAVGVAVNLATFSALDAPGDSHWRALVSRDTLDVVDLGVSESVRTASRYAQPAALSYAAPESVVIVIHPDRGLVARTEQRLWGYGTAADVIYIDAEPPVLPAGFIAAQDVVASGPGGALGDPWLIAMRDAATALPAGVDAAGYLAAAFDGAVAPGETGRTFVLLELAEPEGEFDTKAALVEWELLPADVRAVIDQWR